MTTPEPQPRPIPIHLASIAGEVAGQISPAAGPGTISMSYHLVTLTASEPAQPLLPVSGRRIAAWIQPLDADIAVSQRLSDAAGLAGAPIIPAAGSRPYKVTGSDAVYAGSFGTPEQSIAVADPGTGNDLLYTLPYRAHILALATTYTAGATVTSRFPTISVLDAAGNSVLNMAIATSGITANDTVSIWSAINSINSQGDNFNSWPLFPDVGNLPAGYQVKLHLADASDAITGTHILLRATGGTGKLSGAQVNRVSVFAAYRE